jgi:hypothetical protein
MSLNLAIVAFKSNTQMPCTTDLIGVLVFLVMFPFFGFAQVGVNTTAIDDSAILQVNSTNKGVLFPSLTFAEREAISTPVPAGLIIYCEDCCRRNNGSLYFYNGSNWRPGSSNCLDKLEPLPCVDVEFLIETGGGHIALDIAPLLTDGFIKLNVQPDNDNLRFHKITDTDKITLVFTGSLYLSNLPAGYTLEIYFNDDGNAGIDIALFNADPAQPDQSVNTTGGGLNGWAVNGLGNDDFKYSRVLTSAIDKIEVKGGNNNVHGRLLEVKIFDNGNAEVPLTCN